MKRYFICYSILIFLVILHPFLVSAQVPVDSFQHPGIKFESGLSWQQIKAKAQAENKFIFMDCYATWCGPCKSLDRNIYPDKAVGDYFSSHFINVKVQMDRTVNDDPAVRAWYANADSVARQYKISAYPTFLFFSADGRAVHRFEGAPGTKMEFIEKAAASLDPQRQYFTLLSGWEDHKTDSIYLLHGISAAIEAGDDANAKTMAIYYIASVKEPVNKSNIRLLEQLITSESDAVFQLFLRNVAQLNQMEGKGYVEEKLSPIIFKEDILPLFTAKNKVFDWAKISGEIVNKYPTLNKILFASQLEGPFQRAINKEIGGLTDLKQLRPQDWNRIFKTFKNRFPGYDCGELLIYAKVRYYFDKESWEESAKAAVSLLDNYESKLQPKTINDFIWNYVFLHCSDRRVLYKALIHMENTVKEAPADEADIDTYANLFYKTGNLAQAILWENKAINVAKKRDHDTKDLEDTLLKMQQGEPTWALKPSAK